MRPTRIRELKMLQLSNSSRAMTRKFFTFIAIFSLCAAVFTFCDSDNEPKSSPSEVQKEAVLAALGNKSDLSAFVEALKDLDFSDVDADELTIFAVQNSALPKSALKSTDNDGFIIERHVVKGKHVKSSLTEGKKLTALDGSTLTIKVEGGKIYVNGVELGEEILAGESVVFIVNKIIPASAPNGFENPADAGVRKAQELCECFKKSSDEEGEACAEILHEKYDEYEEDADFEEAFGQELEKCDADAPYWWAGGDNPADPAEAGVKKAQELCECFKKSSDEEGMACAQILHEKYDEFEEDADYEDAFWQELEKCDADTPDWW